MYEILFKKPTKYIGSVLVAQIKSLDYNDL